MIYLFDDEDFSSHIFTFFYRQIFIFSLIIETNLESGNRDGQKNEKKKEKKIKHWKKRKTKNDAIRGSDFFLKRAKGRHPK